MKNSTESLGHASARQYSEAASVPVIGSNFVSLAEQAVKENHSHIHYLEALLAMEREERDRHATQRQALEWPKHAVLVDSLECLLHNSYLNRAAFYGN